MELFALDEQISLVQSELPVQQGESRFWALTRLAWYLRERDLPLALKFAAEAQQMAEQPPLAGFPLKSARIRLNLVSAIASHLYGSEDPEPLLRQAEQWLGDVDDPIVHFDFLWVRALISGDRGDSARRMADLQHATLFAQQAGDSIRTVIAEAVIARFSVFADLRGAQARWGDHFARDVENLPPDVKTWVGDFFGLVAFQSSDFGRAAGYFMHAYAGAMATGQLARAAVAATNIGNSFTNLNDHHTALDWSERALAVIRPTKWPTIIAGCLMQTAEILRHMGRLDAAEQLLHESLATIRPMSDARGYAIAREYLGDVRLDRGDHEGALRLFEEQSLQPYVQSHSEFMISVLRGKAHALSQLGRAEEALASATEAIRLAGENDDAFNHIAALRVLAKIHSDHALPPPPGMSAPSASLHYLQLAVRVGLDIDGYTVPGDLLEAIAREHAKLGDYAQAYAITLQANGAREKTHSIEATNRAIAMQVQYQTERERAEAAHHRKLAESETQRAHVLLQTSSTLEKLGIIGQEITAHLNAAAVFQTLDRHVRGLLDAHHFAVYLIDPEQTVLQLAFGTEDGKHVASMVRLPLSSPTANSARAVRERREVLIEANPVTAHSNLIPGTVPMKSQLFAPLLVGERTLGVMTIQSPAQHAYGERERLIFRTLCAYSAIALDNAAAYRKLEATLKTLHDTKAQLEEASITDPLTGLRNRRFLFQNIEQDVAQTLHRHTMPANERHDGDEARLVFFLVDLDHFKSVNDLHGHAAGDMVLVQISQRLQEVFRESDYLVRWGGEEFLVVAHSITLAEAKLLAARAHAAISTHPFDLANSVKLSRTCSIGFACFPFLPDHPKALSWSQVVELADQCLYMAKRRGRNSWIGVLGTPAASPDAIFQRLMNNMQQVMDAGEVELTCGSSDATRQACGDPALLNANGELTKPGRSIREADPGISAAPMLGLVHLTHDGLIRRLNHAMCNIIGYEEEELLDTPFRALIHSGDATAADDLTRHIEQQELHDFSRELRCVRKDGVPVPVILTISSMRDRDGNFKPTFIVSELAAKKADAREHLDLGTHDPLTGLPNRPLLQDRLRHAIAVAEQSKKQVAVIVIDLDHFKNINDSLGHDVGDQVLIEAGRRLIANLRAVDTVARKGDDEFVVVLPSMNGQTAVAVVAQKLLESLSNGIVIHDQEFFVTASIGISLYPKDGDDSRTLLKNADAAMYSAKDAGRNNFRFYMQEMNARTLDRLKVEAGLRRALERDEFVLHYQPQLDLASGRIIGVEALIRWQQADQPLLYPNHFIPIAEDSNLIVPIGEWVLRRACLQGRAWREAGLPPLRIGVNLSSRQFNQEDIAGLVARVLHETECPPEYLALEITESAVMKDPVSAAETLHRLSEMGVHLSVDDFGTGYSSLNYLKRFPIDSLKIDRSFVSDITTDADSAAIVKGVIALACSLKLMVVAEGVETAEQLEFLRKLECHEMQGYYFSRPVPPEGIVALLNKPRALGIAAHA